MNDPIQISVSESLRGKSVLLTGGSGFLAKVWLAMALMKFPDMGKIYLLIRKKKGASAKDRFREILNSSPALSPLHRAREGELESFLSRRLVILEGDVQEKDYGVSEANFQKLKGQVDFLLHCAGLVHFLPDLRQSFQANVLGAIHSLEVARKLGCPLLHISTAFVAGARSGEFSEEARPDLSPLGEAFDAERELSELREITASSLAPGQNWVQIGRERAERRGWPNTYSYTKALAEALILRRADKVPISILRPTIVESAADFPFPGWNEGLTTCAPLSYLLSGWMKVVSADPRNYVDIVPVDQVCAAMFSVAAALIEGKADSVYHCGTSHHNPVKARFLIEMMGVSQQRHLREKGKTYFDQNYLSRIGTTVREEEGFFNPSNLKSLANILGDLADFGSKFASPTGKALLDRGSRFLRKLKWDLVKAEGVVDAFRPYLRDYNYRFLCSNLKKLETREEFLRFQPERLSWSDYIINVHEPGLRKWCYPLMEGKKPEEFRPKKLCATDRVESLE